MKTHLSTIIFYAFRYCLGRMTYAVSDFCEFAKDNIVEISDRDKELMKKEIKEAIKEGKAGMKMDVEQWEQLLKYL